MASTVLQFNIAHDILHVPYHTDLTLSSSPTTLAHYHSSNSGQMLPNQTSTIVLLLSLSHVVLIQLASSNYNDDDLEFTD